MVCHAQRRPEKGAEPSEGEGWQDAAPGAPRNSRLHQVVQRPQGLHTTLLELAVVSHAQMKYARRPVASLSRLQMPRQLVQPHLRQKLEPKMLGKRQQRRSSRLQLLRSLHHGARRSQRSPEAALSHLQPRHKPVSGHQQMDRPLRHLLADG